VLPVRIGLLLPLTGSQASFGRDALRGAEFAVLEINRRGGVIGRPVELVTRDTGSEVEGAAEAVGGLVGEEGVGVIVGEIASERSLAAAEAARGLGVVLVSPASTHAGVTRKSEWVFRTCFEDPFQAEAMAEFAVSVKARRVGILVEEGNPYSESLGENFRRRFLEAGGDEARVESFRAGGGSFAAQLEALKAGAPDLVYLPCYYPEAAAVINEARQAGMDVPFLGADGWDSDEFLRLGGGAVNDCYFPNHFFHGQPGAETYALAFRELHGVPPPPLAALAGDAIGVVAEAIGRAESESPQAIREALATGAPFHGVTGTISFDEYRSPSKPAVILRIEDGHLAYLETIQPPKRKPDAPATRPPTAETGDAPTNASP
jgi:branched-chain amino acid transport system substrate-binding protein